MSITKYSCRHDRANNPANACDTLMIVQENIAWHKYQYDT